jgi:6-phosphogluconate dehydrogenase
MDIGIWGMGRMGFNMARRLVDKGDHRVIAGNRSSGKVDVTGPHSLYHSQ